MQAAIKVLQDAFGKHLDEQGHNIIQSLATSEEQEEVDFCERSSCGTSMMHYCWSGRLDYGPACPEIDVYRHWPLSWLQAARSLRDAVPAARFRVAVLRKAAVTVSVALFRHDVRDAAVHAMRHVQAHAEHLRRVWGLHFAELPFMATKACYRREGNARRLIQVPCCPALCLQSPVASCAASSSMAGYFE